MKPFTSAPCQTNSAILFVTSYQEGEISGWLAHSRLVGLHKIRSVPQLLFLLNDPGLQEDRMVSYHAFDSTAYEDVPRIATLGIQILFHDYHTWQGRILWEDQKKEAPFRSVWELIQLLDEILAD